jgi:signal transduction histidine kinase
LRKQLLAADSKNQETEDLDLILDEANRCKNIVANLLNFARQGKLNLEKVNLSMLLDDIIKSITVNPLYENIKINIEEETNLFEIDGDEDQLKQVFINIINNACEALEELDENIEKSISIKLKWEGEFLITEIKDNGPGIPKENFSKVFTPFFTTKKIGKGTGLGLAITYGIVKMHRGFISFQSEQGKETAFVVKLPKINNMQTLN